MKIFQIFKQEKKVINWTHYLLITVTKIIIQFCIKYAFNIHKKKKIVTIFTTEYIYTNISFIHCTILWTQVWKVLVL